MRTLALAPPLLFAALAVAPQEKDPRAVRPLDAPKPPSEMDQAVAGDEEMEQALLRAIGGERPDLYLLVRCPHDRQTEALEAYGSGVAVWNGARQVRLPSTALDRILSTLQEARFARLPASFGGQPASLRESPKTPRAGAEVTCQISLETGGRGKTVVQLRKGEQSAEFRALALAVLQLARAHADGGVAPLGLDDALARVAAGELAPELLALSIHRRPGAGETGEAWQLALRRHQAEARSGSPSKGGAAPRRVRLEADEIRSLAAFLRRLEVGSLPANLWSETYTDLDLSVMRWRKAIQARQFAGLAPRTHGKRQEDYDRLLSRLVELRGEVERRSGNTSP